MADALRSGRSVRKDVRVQISPSALCDYSKVETGGYSNAVRGVHKGACSSVGLERSPAEAEVVGSRPSKRATILHLFLTTCTCKKKFIKVWFLKSLDI